MNFYSFKKNITVFFSEHSSRNCAFVLVTITKQFGKIFVTMHNTFAASFERVCIFSEEIKNMSMNQFSNAKVFSDKQAG